MLLFSSLLSFGQCINVNDALRHKNKSTVISTSFTHDKRRILIKVPKDNIERSLDVGFFFKVLHNNTERALDVCLFFKVLKDNTEGFLEVGFFFKVLNKCWRKPKRQSRMDNLEKLSALCTQYTGIKKSSSKI